MLEGYSIGPNDLTQLALGLDRDSEMVAHLFDERNEERAKHVVYRPEMPPPPPLFTPRPAPAEPGEEARRREPPM